LSHLFYLESRHFIIARRAGRAGKIMGMLLDLVNKSKSNPKLVLWFATLFVIVLIDVILGLAS
jgi:hypothetical protein